MEIIDFKLEPSKDDIEPFIALNKLLKYTQLCESGAMANQVIVSEMVQLNGTVDTRKRAKIKAGDVICFEGYQINVK